MAVIPSITLDQEINPWEAQSARFDFAARKLNLDEGLWRVLRSPSREVIVHFPITMDDGRIEVFRTDVALRKPRVREARSGRFRRATPFRRHRGLLRLSTKCYSPFRAVAIAIFEALATCTRPRVTANSILQRSPVWGLEGPYPSWLRLIDRLLHAV